MGDRSDLDRLRGQIDAICSELIHHGSEGTPYLGLRHMLEAEIGTPGRTAAISLDFLGDDIGGEITRQHITAIAAAVGCRIALAAPLPKTPLLQS